MLPDRVRVLCAESTISHNWVLRPVVVLLAILCCLSAVSGQWLETSVRLPDSLGGITNPQTLVWDSLDSKLFVGGDSGVLVVDGATNARVARVPTGSTVDAICYNAQNNKVYCANYNSANVTVIDGASNSVLATVADGGSPTVLYYNPINYKVYCANQDSGNVMVINGATNQVLRTIGVGAYPYDFTWNPVQNRVYVANSGSSFISVLRDSMSGIEEGFSPQAASTRPAPSVVRGVLFLPGAASPKPQASSLLDITGRKVLDLHPGANDVRALAPGVYFVREQPQAASSKPQAVQKVVVTR